MTVATEEIICTEDTIDSRDIITRIEYLESAERDEDEQQELDNLKAVAEEAEGYAEDWKYGVILIRDSYFEDYARELASDIGAIQDDMNWPCNCIDWEQAAKELQIDYSCVEFDGVDYWYR